jgi:tetratricopeptide (TPR) repeat protein
VLADATLRIAESAKKQPQPIAAAPITPPAVQPHYLSSQREEVLRLLSTPAPYAGRQPSNRVRIAIAASVFALAAVFGLNWISAKKEANHNQPGLGLLQPAKQPPPELASSSARQTVMAEVRELIAQGALITPEQNCALALVMRLLEQTPSDAGALNLLREIGTALSVQVQERWRAGDRADALSLLRTGLTRLPNDAELNRLRADLQAEIERGPGLESAPAMANSADTAALFNRAEALYARSQLSAPAGDNAVEVLYAILKQEPNHTQAQAMLAKIAGDYERVALVWQERGRVDQALAQVRNGLKAQPANERLRRLELTLLGP